MQSRAPDEGSTRLMSEAIFSRACIRERLMREAIIERACTRAQVGRIRARNHLACMNPSAHEWNIDGKCARPRLHLDVRREVDLHGERREVANVRAIEEHGNPPLRAQRHAEEEVHRRPPIKIAGIVHVAMGASRVDLMREAIRRIQSGDGSKSSGPDEGGNQECGPPDEGRNQRPSVAIKSQSESSEVISGHPRSSEIISVPGWRYATGSAES